MNPYLILASLGLMALATASGYKLGVDHEVAARAREDKHIQEAVTAATEASAKAISEIRPKYTTIQSKVRHEIETNTVYRDCKLTPDGLRYANQALTGASAPSPSNSELPKTDTVGQ